MKVIHKRFAFEHMELQTLIICQSFGAADTLVVKDLPKMLEEVPAFDWKALRLDNDMTTSMGQAVAGVDLVLCGVVAIEPVAHMSG